MIYPDNFEQKIEFHKVRQLVSNLCLSPLGEEKVSQMKFSHEYPEIKSWLQQTDEFMHIIQEEDNFPIDYFYDVRPVLKNIQVVGSWMEASELFRLRRSLHTIQAIVSFLQRNKEEPLYPSLFSLAENVLIFPEVIKKIDTILDNAGQVKDNASPRLAEIRSKLSSTMQGISKTLNNILRKAQADGFVDKDVTPNLRDGRLVIPVIPAYKRKIKGIVHDESASGKTIYIEPAEVVEANNRIRELENNERREIIAILLDFTDYLRPLLRDIISSYEFLGQIDFIRAKALFAMQVSAIAPVPEDKCKIDWVHAVHPLLFLALQKQNRKVVPLDIALDDENRILIISGPNAGGKSVCLKTVGLLQYMVQCGLPIPVRENSKVGIFHHIFIDIGDEQSIENDLSTYSSHLLNMKFFLKNCNSKTLLLIDEFGGGTEPQIGAAIAESLLSRFNEQLAFGVITTHYQNLKHFANETQGIQNAAMLYDRHEMRPLFRLSIGNPGSSFAVEIARKIGLPEEIIAHASEIVGSDYINMDKYLQDIARDKRYWERKRDEIRRKNKRVSQLEEQVQQQTETIEKQKKEILSQAKTEAEQLLSKSNALIEQTIREIKQAQAEKEKTKEARQSLTQFKHHITASSDQNQAKKHPKKKMKKVTDNSIIRVGDNVQLRGQESIGEVMEISGKKAIVAFGMLKSSIEIEKLQRVSNRQKQKELKASNTGNILHEKRLHFKHDIDVRGMRGDEALQAVIYFVDDAIQLGVSRIRILHGTGTGALRQIIRDYLATVAEVTHFRDEHVQFGGAGITVIDLE